MTGTTPTDTPPPDANSRVDRLLVCSIGGFLIAIGIIGLLGYVWSRRATDAGPGDPTLAVIALLAGGVALAIGLRRRQDRP